MDKPYAAALSLLRAALAPGEPTGVEEADLDAVFAWGTRQQLLPLLYDGALRLPGFAASEAAIEMAARVGVYMARSAEQTEAMSRLSEAFDAAGIDHMPLKGALMRALYPVAEWRVMGDLDILVRREDYGRIAPLLRGMGCTQGVESDHEYHWLTPEGVHIELHKSLVPTYDTDLYTCFGDGWSRALPVAGSPHRFTLSPEDTYLYAVAHFAKHMRNAGAGVRYVLDLWLLQRRGYDTAIVGPGLASLGLTAFHERMTHLAAVWLEGAVSDALTERLTERLCAGGVYGSPEEGTVAVLAGLADSVGRARRRRLRALLFPSYEALCRRRPGKRRPPRVVLPFWWMVRWGELVCTRRIRCRSRITELSVVTDEGMSCHRAAMEDAGLCLPGPAKSRKSRT